MKSSPISNRTTAQPLTLELLRKHVPIVRAGHEALQKLRESTTTDDTTIELLSREEKRKLLELRNKGQHSQEILVISALPLIKSITSKESQRRRGWNSRVSYDDLLQEAIAGFIRGLLAYNETANHSSATNYLGQWITASMRRKIEVMEHDFAIPYEVIERNRRIKAVRGRLISELGTEPTNEQLLDVLNSPEQYNTGYKWGRVSINGIPTAKAGKKQFTEKHLQEESELSSKSYSLTSPDSQINEEEAESYERAGTPLSMTENTSQDQLALEDLSKSQLLFFEKAFLSMKVGSRQKDILLRLYGLSPYRQPQQHKEINAETGYSAKFIKEVMMAFSTYMPLTGGIFHQMLLSMSADEIEDLEMSWLLPHLGDWPKNQKTPINPPDILTAAERVKK